ncbi:mevalonate kinase [Candidatus Microgenomates bacterium]|nr:mevalonate kinase [Candidatus Microgenomates bacterium]
MKQFNNEIVVSAPAKVHLLGEHSVVYGKPAILATLDLRVTFTTNPSSNHERGRLSNVIEPIIKKYLKIKTIPPYRVAISSQIPQGVGLGSSAAVSASYIAALLSFLKVKWDLNLINKLTYEAEKVFHGNPSGADNSTVVFGGLIWFRKESEDLKIIQPLTFSIPAKLAKNFYLINTGTPKESTKEMVTVVKNLYDKNEKLVNKFLEDQEKLVKELLNIIKAGNEVEMIRIIRAGEANLESIGVCSPYVKKIIRQIEKSGGAAKICGAGATSGPTGVLLAYHPNKNKLIKVVKSLNLSHFTVRLGVEGLKKEEFLIH